MVPPVRVIESAYRIAYAGSFRFPLTPPEVWRALERSDRFEMWWPWMRSLRMSGSGIAEGAEWRFEIAAPLPSRMKVATHIVESVAPARITARVTGDLEGDGSLELRPGASETVVDVRWDVEVVQRPMRAAIRVARPVVTWAHDWAVRTAVDGFRDHLAGGHEL